MRPATGQCWPRVNPGSEVSEGGGQVALGATRLNFTGDVNVTAAGDEVEVEVEGGGAATFPIAPPETPSAFDDEFVTPTLDAKWTQTLTPGISYTVDYDKYGSWLSSKGPGSVADRELQIRQALSGFAAGTALSLTCRLAMRSAMPGSLTARCTVAIGDNSSYTTGNYVGFGIALGSANQMNAEVFDGGGSDYSAALPSGAGEVWFHFQRTTGNVVNLWISLDGTGWQRISSETRNWAASYLFISLRTHNAAANPGEELVDFVRVNDARFTMPE